MCNNEQQMYPKELRPRRDFEDSRRRSGTVVLTFSHSLLPERLLERIPGCLRSPPRSWFKSPPGLTGIHLQSQNTVTSVCWVLMRSHPRKNIKENELHEAKADLGRDGGCTTNYSASCLYHSRGGGIPRLFWETPSCSVYLSVCLFKETPLIFQKQIMAFRLREVK